MPSHVESWEASLLNTYGTPAIQLVSGQDSTVVDADGKEYLDLLAGIAVNSLGHAHPSIVEAVTKQISTLGHISNLYASQPVIALAAALRQRLANAAQGAGVADVADDAKVFFCNSGAEANEAAFKLARLSGRGRILAAHHGFHGRTMGALALTGQPQKQAPFRPLPAGVEFYPYGDIEYLRKLVAQNPADTAAIMLEPIQGETGVVPAPAGFLAAVRELCDEHGILMIVDEVQTGAGRTGTFFNFEQHNVLPDAITMAKGLGGGLPIGALITHGPAAKFFQPGSHGTTFGGNPVVCAAGLAVLEYLDDANLEAVTAKGTSFATALEALPEVETVRGQGLMLGVVLKQPIAKLLVQLGLEHGILCNAPNEHVLRLTPPLIITEEEITQAVATIGNIIPLAVAQLGAS